MLYIIVVVDIVEPYYKFITANSRDKVRLSNGVKQSFGNCNEYFVARFMSMGVVEGLEFIVINTYAKKPCVLAYITGNFTSQIL